MKPLLLLLLAVSLCSSAGAKKKAEKNNLPKENPPTIEELAAITARGKKLAEYDVAAWHATDVIQDLVLSNRPEDSDVFYVLTRRPSIPEFVATMDKRVWMIDKDGTIKLSK